MIVAFLFLIGIFLGSFLGVVIDRVPQKKTILYGRSACDFCGHTLSAFDLVPILSFISLRGKCRYCHKKLSFLYPSFEIFTGIVFAGFYLFLGQPTTLLPFLSYLLLCGIFLTFFALFMTDLQRGVLPNGLIIFDLILVLFSLFIALPVQQMLPYILSGISAGTFFLFIILITKGKGMGMGDMKLAFLIGFFLGFPHILVALYAAFLTGAGVAIILIVVGKKKFRGGTISFGPFLILGTMVAYFWGDLLWHYFLSIL